MTTNLVPEPIPFDSCADGEKMALRGQCADCNALRAAFDAYKLACKKSLKAAVQAIRKSGAPHPLLKAAQTAPTNPHLAAEAKLPECICSELSAFRALIKLRVFRLKRILINQEKEVLWRDTVPPIYQKTAIDRLPYPEISRAVLGYSPEDEVAGVLLFGSTGAGKTRTAFLLLHHWLFTTPWPWTFRYLQGSEIADAANARSRTGTVGDWVAELVNGVDCIFIDDIGHGNFSNSYAEVLRRLVEVCTSGRIPLVITCQFDGKQLLKQWSREEPGKAETAKAIVRRLFEFCRPVRIHDRATKPLKNQ